MAVLKERQFRDKTVEELREYAEEHDISVPKSAKKEVLIQRIVESSYPVVELPKARETSRRGYVILSFVDEEGEPRTETNLDQVKKDLVEKFDLSENEAESTVKMYLRDLVRYYGYSIKSESGGTVKLSDYRRAQLAE